LASGSPVTANVVSGGSGAGLVSAGGGLLGGAAGAPAAGGGAVTNLVGNVASARPVQGVVGGTLNTVGGVLGNVTGGLARR
jgi:hypothetical protein